MSVDAEVQRRELNERRALRIVGVCFLLLAAYIASESALDLWSRRAPEHSIPGMALACVSLVVMPLLSRAKRKVGHALGSAAMHVGRHTNRVLHVPIRHPAGWVAAQRSATTKASTPFPATLGATSTSHLATVTTVVSGRRKACTRLPLMSAEWFLIPAQMLR
jgi:hypothetical protein